LKIIYYIGKTTNPKFRIENHFNSNGSEWTKQYRPLRVFEFRSNCDDYDEDKITIQYMDKYGIDNVRGGTFVSVNLEKSIINILEKMSNSANNNCFNCGGKDHFTKNCQKIEYQKININEEYEYEEEIWICNFCNKEFLDEYDCDSHINYCNSNKKINKDKYEEIWICQSCKKEFTNEYDCDSHIKYCKFNKKQNNCFSFIIFFITKKITLIYNIFKNMIN